MYVIELFSKFGKEMLWGHEKGKECRDEILKEWTEQKDNTLVLDFIGIKMVDLSFPSDIVCIPISRLANELEGKHIIIKNATGEVGEHIATALERRELCCVNLTGDNKYEIIGKCSEGLKQIFDYLYNKKKGDSRQLADDLNTTVQIINNRMATLYKLGLVKRETIDAPTGGKQHIYSSIL